MRLSWCFQVVADKNAVFRTKAEKFELSINGSAAICAKEKALAIMTSAQFSDIEFCYVVVDFDHKTAGNFMIEVNPAQIVYPSNDVIESFAAPMIWAG